MEEIIKLEFKIMEIIRNDNYRTVHFLYTTDPSDNSLRLKTITYYYKRGSMFVMFDTVDPLGSKKKVLTDTLDYLMKTIDPTDMLVYEIEWYKQGENEIYKSKFCDYTFGKIINKFYDGKKHDEYIIKHVKLFERQLYD